MMTDSVFRFIRVSSSIQGPISTQIIRIFYTTTVFYLYDNSVCNEVPIFNNFQGKKVINNIFIESLILLCISWNLYLRNNWWIQILSSLHTTKMSNKLRTDTRVNKVSLLLRRVPFMLNSLLNKTKYKPINGIHY